MWTSVKKSCGVAMMVGAMSLAGATVASAATLSFVGGTLGAMDDPNFSTGYETNCFNSIGACKAAADAFIGADTGTTDLQVYNSTKTASEGLSLNGAGATVKLRFTYLGSEAAFHNLALIVDGAETQLFDNQTASLGDSVVLSFTDFNGLLPFVYRSARVGDDAEAQNAGTIDPGLWLAYARTDAGANAPFYTNAFGLQSTIAFFGDGTADDVRKSDYNDMVVGIGVVPVPPAVVFLLTAIAGLGVVRSRRSKVNA